MRCSVLISAELGRGRLDREPFRARLRAGSAPLLGTSPHKDNILASRDPSPLPPRSGEGGGTGVGARFFRRCNLCVPTLPPAVRSAGPLFARSFSFFTAPLVSARSRLLSLPFLRRSRSPPPSLPPSPHTTHSRHPGAFSRIALAATRRISPSALGSLLRLSGLHNVAQAGEIFLDRAWRSSNRGRGVYPVQNDESRPQP